jgi:hypothetical protein
VVKQARRFELASYDLLARPGLRHVPLNALLSSLAAFRSLRSYSESLGPSPYTELVGDSVGEEFRRGYGNAQEFIRRLAARGGKVVAGSDAAASPTVPGAALHQELELLVEAGLSPMQAIQAATKHPAELFRQGYKLGTVEPAKLADLVILDGDPLADIRNLGKIHIVLKNGTVMDTRYRATYAPELAELEDVGVSSSTAPVPRIFEVITRTLNTWSMVINNGSPFDVIVKGQGFHSMSVVHLNGRPLATTFVSSGELRARVPTQSIPAAGVFPVTVVTPWPGGGTSNPVGLVVK